MKPQVHFTLLIMGLLAVAVAYAALFAGLVMLLHQLLGVRLWGASFWYPLGFAIAEVSFEESRSISEDNVDPYPTLREAVAEICGPKITARKIGYALRNYRGRVCGGKRLIAEAARAGVKRWRIETITIAPNQTPSPLSGGDGGHGCDESSQSGSKELFTNEL